ncbi:Hypothetical_protein [Hexamita inflata]|uniref:Hypothetical_protein n=1 Tax=Hexamita inflata TaxID=28002 RepID=A0AA86RLP3_9EUKA|nr:Hypothetical protein HINF_LOCUS66642 [Hexamita inflata]
MYSLICQPLSTWGIQFKLCYCFSKNTRTDLSINRSSKTIELLYWIVPLQFYVSLLQSAVNQYSELELQPIIICCNSLNQSQIQFTFQKPQPEAGNLNYLFLFKSLTRIVQQLFCTLYQLIDSGNKLLQAVVLIFSNTVVGPRNAFLNQEEE